MKSVFHELRRTAMMPNGAGASDGELLEQFIAQKSELAFETLVRRHGAMVFGVCRRVTGHSQDAEDAFQAAFLVLARKAATVKPRELLGNWLYGVAWRSALEARTKAARRHTREQPLDDMPDTTPRKTDHREACALLDQELAKLPDKYRSAIVLCELEGRSRHEVASRLGIPEGTLSSRLAYARKLLTQRLTRRGVVLSAAGLVGSGSANAMSAGLVAATVKTCVNLAAGQALTVVGASASVLTITENVMKSMLLGKLKKAATMVVTAICLAGLGTWSVLAVDGQNADPLPPADKALIQLGDPPPRAQLQGEGRIMIFRDGGLATMNPDGKELRWILEKNDKVLLHPFRNGSLSPDGKRLALLVVDREAIEASKGKKGAQRAVAHVHVRDVNEKGVGQKVGLTGVQCTWSGDSANLLITELDEKPGTDEKPREFTAKSWILNIKTKEKKALDLPKNHLVCDWSRDGQWLLACAIEPGKSRLVLERQDGTEAHDVTSGGPLVFGKLSPDGKKVLYIAEHRGENPRQELLVQSVLKKGKAEPLCLSALNHDILGFTWSPDGRRVAYTCKLRPNPDGKDRDGPLESFLIIVNADGTNLVTAQTEKAAVPLGSLEWR